MSSVLFVFYSFPSSTSSSIKAEWEYKNLPLGWNWVGSGSTHSVNSKKISQFEYDEQFMGPLISREKLKKYLDSFFTRLKNKGAIKMYKIRKSYLP